MAISFRELLLVDFVCYFAGLVKHFFDCGCLKALAINIIAAIIYIVIVAVLVLIGIGISLLPIGNGIMHF